MTPSTFLILIASVTLNAAAQIFLRLTMAGRDVSAGAWAGLALRLVTSAPFWAGMGCFGLSIGLWLIVLSRLPVGVAYPLASLGYIVATALGVLFLGEGLSLARVLGVGFICIGVFVISRTA